MLRRWRSFKKIVYAAAILLMTIILYASTSNNEYASYDVESEWRLPAVSDGTLRVDRALLEPLHRLPLGPFQDHDIPVIIETLNFEIPIFNESDSKPKSSDDNQPSSNNNNVAVPAAKIQAQPAVAPIAPGKPGGGGVNSVAQKPPSVPSKNPSGPIIPVAGVPAIKPATNGEASINISSQAKKAPVVGAVKPPPPPPPPSIPLKPLPDLTKTASEMSKRLIFTKAQCDKFKFPHEVDADVYVLSKYNLTYCKVPKSGSTYWEQVFSYLNKLPKELEYLGIKSPFQISKYDIRYTSHFTLPRHNWKLEAERSAMMKTKRILFVRHPLERLWSSYIEKFYLIDFWSTLGLQVKSKGTDLKCPKSITFREFVDFTLPIFNEFWAPITELCNPCTYFPTFIGHIETLREDSLYILKESNLKWIFGDQEKISRQESHMIDMLIYNYQIHSIQWYGFFHKCFTQKDLATRLWDVFRKIGYLTSHAALPDNLPDYNQTTIIKEIKIQSTKYPLDDKNGRAQLLKMMRRDYEGLPKPIMAKILEKYAMDFELFGYSTLIPIS